MFAAHSVEYWPLMNKNKETKHTHKVVLNLCKITLQFLLVLNFLPIIYDDQNNVYHNLHN